ncbi:hypothetical protein BGZ46_006938 [Entomortierella lignicola]|nr:hypothetical protein BGZ46_006938 [Entomortierella lignicola]
MTAHHDDANHTTREELPSTLSMCLENPSSASLALSISSTHIEPHGHHNDLELHSHHQHHGEVPSFVSEKLGTVQEQSASDLEMTDGTVHSVDGTTPDSTNNKVLDYPEGGFGWLVVLASFVVNFWAFSPNMTFGVYQAYFLQANTFPGALATQISWVGSIGTASMFIPGPFVAPLTRFIGLRAVVAVGIIAAALGLILASFTTELWHLYITQGFLFGCGGGLVFFSSISVTAQYFEKRRGLANGIAVAGSGIGGLAVSPLTRFLITQVGYRWCQRIIGFAVLGFMSAIFPFIRPRIKTVRRGPIFDFSLFKAPGFVPLMLTAFIVPFGKT